VGDEVLLPRKSLVSVAYGIRAQSANYAEVASLADYATDSYHAVHADTAANSQPDDDWAVDGDDVYRQWGNVGIGTATPSYPLDVSGAVRASTYHGDGSLLTGIAGAADDDWNIEGGNIYRATGKVGIRMSNPIFPLDVDGAVRASTYYGDGSHLTGISGTTDNDWTIDGLDVHHTMGNVGIGVTNPLAKLHVESDSTENALMAKAGWSYPIVAEWSGSDSGAAILAKSTGTGGDGIRVILEGAGRSALFAQASSGADYAIWAQANGADWAGYFTGDMHASGNVGIGTTTPMAKLHIEGTGSENALMAKASWSYPIIAEWGGSGEGAAILAKNTGTSGDALQAVAQGSGRSAIYAQAASGSDYALWAEANGAEWAGFFSGDMHASGQVGIGITSLASHQLSVRSSGSAESGSAVHAENTAPDGIAMTLETNSNNPTLLISQYGSGDMLRCENWASKDDKAPRVSFKIQSDGRIVGSVLELTGGSDLAEPFNVTSASEVTPGMLVCIDSRNPGQLVLSSRPYDRTVAGIISGAGQINPGMVMGQVGSVADGQYPVALTGRAYCWAEASNGSIQPGDLLTSSQVPGYAMKVTNHHLAQGAIIGKAMSSLESGKGLVLVLVTLQ
jgi:hypothetical protein